MCKFFIDFKNLIGRVGRIKYNLSGNVFIIPKDGQSTVTECTKMINTEISNKELSIKTTNLFFGKDESNERTCFKIRL